MVKVANLRYTEKNKKADVKK